MVFMGLICKTIYSINTPFMHKKIIILILFYIISTSYKCTNSEMRFIEKHIHVFENIKNINTVLMDGIYLVEYIPINIDDGHGKFNFGEFIMFFGNGFCSSINLYSNTDSFEATKLVSTKNVNEIEKGGGVFTIDTNKIIKLLIRTRISISGGRLGYTFAIFSGKLSNYNDTITSFRMIEPFPKQHNIYDTIPRTLVFQKFPAKLTLDSNNYYIKKFIK